MEMAYIQAENLKHKRTFTKTLIVLAPFVTALMNFFAPLWFQLNSYNWWYILLYPGFLTLTCALIEQRDNGKLKYRAVASLPVSQNKVWKAKIGVAGIYSCVGNFIFLALNLLGGFAILVINEIPLTIGIWQAAAGTACIVIASLWEVPLCLWLSRKVGIFVTVILNAGLGSVLGIFTATTSLWMICAFGATFLALGTFAALYRDAPASLYLKAGILLLITMLPIYLIHLFVGMSFGKGASMGLGIAGSLIAALMITGLGDATWKYIPWAWGVRAMDYTVLAWDSPQLYAQVKTDFFSGMIISVCCTVCLLIASLVWFHGWEGGKNSE